VPFPRFPCSFVWPLVRNTWTLKGPNAPGPDNANSSKSKIWEFADRGRLRAITHIFIRVNPLFPCALRGGAARGARRLGGESGIFLIGDVGGFAFLVFFSLRSLRGAVISIGDLGCFCVLCAFCG